MPRFSIAIEITAPIERCFDLARSIEFHSHSMSATGERAIAGRVSGLIELDEKVTWEARHLCVRQRLTSRITRFDRPHLFTDEMVQGAFRWFRHDHRFEQLDPRVVRLTDDFVFEAPLGLLGVIGSQCFLKGYMRRLLAGHQRRIKSACESDEWRRFLPSSAVNRTS